VGLGTFRPVKTPVLTDHQMHEETYSLSAETWQALNNKASGGPKLAIGTTALRALESALQSKNFSPDQWHETNLFLYPGKQVQAIDALLTNFHLPESSLLMLVSSLIGRVKTLELYREAIEKKYRFFSYGDAMLILRKDNRE
jgi:S-adenosylmethionine:tRNA ribosyltransferase-isomerase